MIQFIARSSAIAMLVVEAACIGGGTGISAAPTPATRPNVLTADVIASAGAVPLEQLIADRIPGVQLDHNADGLPLLHIRGTMGWRANRQPLYIVDGFPLMTLVDAPPYINKADIERVEVLEGAAMATMYGSRAANGVILIETKRR